MSVTNLRGIVLKEYPSGESSKRIVVLTKEMGKVNLHVKGAKSGKSKFLSATQLFCYSDFVVYEGKGFFSVTQAEVLESFYSIREDIIKLSYSAYILEFVEKTMFEGMREEEVLKLLLYTLTVISKANYDVLLAVSIFEIKYLQLMGLWGEIGLCGNCGRDLQIYYFTPQTGFICENCKDEFPFAAVVSGGAFAAVSHVLKNEDKKIFSFNVSKKVRAELRLMLERYILQHTEQKFFTLDFAKSCEEEG